MKIGFDKMEAENYIEAVKEILKGNPVENLDKLRVEYNKSYWKWANSLPRRYNGPRIRELSRLDSPIGMIVTFVVDAENKILMGTNPIKAYSGFEGLEPKNFRQRGRNFLENWCNEIMNEFIATEF